MAFRLVSPLSMCAAVLIVVSAVLSVSASDKVADVRPQYCTQGFFISRPLPIEGENVTFYVRATGAGTTPYGRLVIKDAAGKIVSDIPLTFSQSGDRYVSEAVWRSSKNGIYSAEASLGGDGCVFENTQARTLQLLVPVIVKGRVLHFPWFAPRNYLRWMTVSTATGKESIRPLRERGIKALQWTFGGMNYVNQDWNKSKSWEEFEKSFTEMYSNGLKQTEYDGVGIDEFGGYPGTREEQGTTLALSVLRELRKVPECKGYVAAWNGGMLRPDRAQLYRESCDLLLQETYVFGAMQGWLLTENIYAMLDDKVMAGARGTDTLVPSYGQGCTTIQCLDIVAIPAKMELGEIEQVVRYLRRIVPEMRGIGFYNGVDFPEGSTPEQIERLERFGDAMCLKYFIKPVVTLMKNSLWVQQDSDGKTVLAVGVSNIGAMDSGPVKANLYDNGRKVGVVSAKRVPAGASGHTNRVVLKSRVNLKSGYHSLEAIIYEASGSTVLDGQTATKWYLEP